MYNDMSQAIETTCLVSDTGLDSGNGYNVPISIKTLGDVAKTMWPGVTIDLSGGTYHGDYLPLLSGNPQGGITIRNGIIDGSFSSRSKRGFLRNLIIYDADFLDRENNIPQHDGIRLDLTASNIRVENCIIHDCRQGTLKDIDCQSIEYYGNLIYFNGWSAPDRGHGHGIYAANGNDTPLKIHDNILHGQFGWGLHCYGEGTEILKNIQVEGCTLFGNGGGNIIGGIGAGSTVRTSWMKNCCVKDNLQIGGVSTGCIDFILTDNVIIGNLTMRFFGDNPIITGNKFFGKVAITNGDTGQLLDAPTVFPDNEYLESTPDYVSLRANAYDETRAHLTIFNGSEAATIEVDVSAIYTNGTQVQARNVQDYFVDIQTLTVTAGKITINMQAANRTVATPQGWVAPATTFPTFGCFVLVKQ